MTRLSGKVIEQWSGMPVSGAVVTVNGITVIADSTGYFSVDTPYQSANIQAMHVSHEPMSEVLSLSAGENQIEITLTPKVRAL